MNCLITITGISETGDADSVETKSLGMVHSVKTEAGSGYRLDYRTAEDGFVEPRLSQTFCNIVKKHP